MLKAKQPVNVDYYHKRKKENYKNNYRCENGFFNSVDQDKYVVRKLKRLERLKVNKKIKILFYNGSIKNGRNEKEF